MISLEIGKKIRYLRKGKGVTQEILANYLGVTTQAVSKWENEATAPDISLLPMISVYFGITIDDLFSLTDDAKLERIDNMIDNNRYLLNSEFNESEDLLKDIIENANNSDEKRIKAYTILSYLYLNKVAEYQDKAEEYAMKGIELAPLSSDLHKALNNAHKVPTGDWNVMNHKDRIDYYKGFIKKYPNHRTGYMWLLDALISDGRLQEAIDSLKEYEMMVSIRGDKDWRTMHYKALIESKLGNNEKVNDIWDEMIKTYGEIDGPYFERAVEHAYNGEWEDAISYFQKDFDLKKTPRYTDSLDAIGKIYEIIGDSNKAIDTYKEYIKLLESEWNITEGEIVDYPKRQIQRLNNKL